jgi:hypothetical protein
MKKAFRQAIRLSFLLFIPLLMQAQDIDFARRLIDTLCSPAFVGRGYVNDGDMKAAKYLASEFREIGLQAFSDDYLQYYSFPMNTLPGKLQAGIDGKKLTAGSEFQVWVANPDVKGSFEIIRLKKADTKNHRKFNQFEKQDFRQKFILVDKKGITDKQALSRVDTLRFLNPVGAAGYIFISENKPGWSVSLGAYPRNYSVVDVKREAMPRHPESISLEVETEFLPLHPAANVIGWIKGALQPDTFLVFTAHFDHLGRMGKEVYYPGANDNASGTAMVTDLARHYSLPGNQPRYSMIFILLSGEEAGLKGSNFCAENPPVDLKKVKFLINLDMVGTGSGGITLVNATVFKDAYDWMEEINSEKKYLAMVKPRSESCNSDHCPFYKKGVPAIFIYSMGKEFGEYHNIDDRADKVPLTEYNDIFSLVRDFMDSFGNKTAD